MIVDTSAVLAVLLGESDAEVFGRHLAKDEDKFMTPFNALEADVVVTARKGEDGKRELDLLLHSSGIEILPFSNDMRVLAAEAWQRYGKGRHPAGLNIGDCCAYALASFMNQALLFKGNDFSHTDLQPVLTQGNV